MLCKANERWEEHQKYESIRRNQPTNQQLQKTEWTKNRLTRNLWASDLDLTLLLAKYVWIEPKLHAKEVERFSSVSPELTPSHA